MNASKKGTYRAWAMVGGGSNFFSSKPSYETWYELDADARGEAILSGMDIL